MVPITSAIVGFSGNVFGPDYTRVVGRVKILYQGSTNAFLPGGCLEIEIE